MIFKVICNLPVRYKGIQGVKFKRHAIVRFSFHLCFFPLKNLRGKQPNQRDGEMKYFKTLSS